MHRTSGVITRVRRQSRYQFTPSTTLQPDRGISPRKLEHAHTGDRDGRADRMEHVLYTKLQRGREMPSCSSGKNPEKKHASKQNVTITRFKMTN
ncbi:hypothetical protein RRG08_046194 [Elysia crispata]|uniref:Uncharacterized protein n=1 Tax=Elysia crispata TaxID=231223 RepID=A0AAE1CJH2_9GAST|nr:hypothetical protein RRG08_046194 [Elysia crispata]